MKSVVMIAYHFPPEGNAGAHRPLRFVRELSSKGWQPTVITLATDFYERYDSTLLSLVPAEIDVIRVRNPDPWKAFQHWRGKHFEEKLLKSPAETVSQLYTAHQAPIRSRLRELARAAEALCYHPDLDMGWIRPAVNATLKHCAKVPDVIWATAGPLSSFVVAQKLSRYTCVPYVLDFRDSWTITYNDFEERRPSWAKRYEERRMYRLLAKAQSLVFRFATEAECYWRAYKGAVDASKVYIIPNGYEGMIGEFVPPIKSERCELLYTGTLSDYRFDTLLQAVAALKRSSPQIANRLHFRFIGEGADGIARAAAQLGLSELIEAQGSVSQAEVTKLMGQAHALLILARPSTMRGYELFAAAKLFGYLKTGMPIIGIVPADETRNVLLRIGVSTIADVDSPLEIAAVLTNLVQAWSQDKLFSLVPERAKCQLYSAEQQVRELTRALGGLPAAEPFVPGRTDVPASLRVHINKMMGESEQRIGLGTTRQRITLRLD